MTEKLKRKLCKCGNAEYSKGMCRHCYAEKIVLEQEILKKHYKDVRMQV